MWITYQLYVDILKNKEKKDISKYKVKANERGNFRSALIKIIVANVTLSLDNVIAIAGAAKANYTLLIFGLILAIVLMTTIANAISIYLKNHKWVGWLGLISILWVAGDLIWHDIHLLF